jgi:hypothetical protein
MTIRWRDQIPELDRPHIVQLFSMVVATTEEPLQIVRKVQALAREFQADAERNTDMEGINRWGHLLAVIDADLAAAVVYAGSMRAWVTKTPEEQVIANRPSPGQLTKLRAMGFTGEVHSRHHAHEVLSRLEAAEESQT